ncbi:MAG: hypothetical protein ABR905_12110 [Terracidiphilus sp.]
MAVNEHLSEWAQMFSCFLGGWHSMADRKIRINFVSRICRTLVYICFCALVSETGSAQAASSTAPAPAPAVTAESPITLDQLRKLLDELHEVEQTRAITQEEAERQRATLPPWFPKSVWDAVEQKMGSVDIAKVELPIYQRYLTSETGDGLILWFNGPLGQQLAEQVMSRRVAIAETGAQGSKAAQTYIDGATQSDKGIASARLNQLGPTDRERAIKAVQALTNSWKTMSDDLAKLYDEYVNNLVQTELAKHSQELAAAQQAYMRKSSSQPARHQ